MRKIRRGDEVVVRTGRDKGRRGQVVGVLDEQRVLVQGINLVKKHVKPNPMKGEPGGIVAKEAPIQVSNIAIFNPATSKADRVGIRVLEDGSRVRFFKSTGETIAG
ncbi:MAG: 50S ribosomal protein L24 [Burkholderiales bacterium]|jgi:large subunit ribosomal protein L24|nr:50S ribosomal protein L24 [Betaproteobacteria bacterium]